MAYTTPRIGQFTAPCYVCTVSVLYGFGEMQSDGHSSADGYEEYPPVGRTFSEFLVGITKAYYVDFLRRGSSNSSMYGGSMLLAFLTTTQPLAIGFLKEFGFKASEPIWAPKYTDHKTVFLMIHPREFVYLLNKHIKDHNIDTSILKTTLTYGYTENVSGFMSHLNNSTLEGIDDVGITI